MQTVGGTNFTASFDPALAWVKTSGLINPRYWSNLPAGEVFTTPASVDGKFVCDGTAGNYFNASTAASNARRSSSRSAGAAWWTRPAIARPAAGLLDCRTDPHSDRVGELAFGTNLGSAR